MRRLAALLALLPLAAVAQTTTPTQPPTTQPPPTPPPANQPAAAPPPPSDPWLARPVAEIIALDKITARAVPLTIKTGQTATFGALSITVRYCMVRPPDQMADATAYFDIIDTTQAAPPFHAWMILSAPAVSMLQHPIYDIRLSGCHA